MKSIEVMSSFNKTLIIFLSLSICFCVGDAQVVGYRLVQQWPKAVCNVNSRLCYNTVPRFTIHGLWPYNRNGASLTNCKGSAYNVTLVSAIPQINYAWPSLDNRKPNRDLWKHEWEKHGTCSGLDQTNYFGDSVSWYNRTNLLTILGAKVPPIRPNNQTYTLQAILDAFAYGIQVHCQTNSKKQVLLVEIYTCIALNGAYINCPGASQTGCGQANIKFLAY